MKPGGVLSNTTALLVIQIANQLVPLVTLPYLTRTLGADTYGAYAYAIAITTIACVVTDFGFTLWGTGEVSQNRGDPNFVNRIYGAVTAAKLGLFAIATSAVAAYASFSGLPSDHKTALYLTAIPILGLTLQPIWMFNGLERMASITAFILFSRLTYTALVFVVIESPSDLGVLIAINGLSQLLAAALGIIVLVRLGHPPRRPSVLECRNVLKSASPFFLSRVAISTYTAGGAVFLGLVSTTRSVAIYAVAEQLYRGAQGLLSPLGQVMYPYMMRTRNYRVLGKSTLAITLAAAIGSALTAALGNQVIHVLFGAEFAASVPVLNIFLVVLVVNTPSVLLGYPMLGSLGRVQLANRSVIFGAGAQICILLAFYLVDRRSPVDVALAVLGAELVVLTLRAAWSYSGWREFRAENGSSH